MDRNSMWKWLILIALTATSIAFVYPPGEKITKGLDLQGGTSFTVDVLTEGMEVKEKADAQERALKVLRTRVDELGTTEPIIYPEPGKDRIVVQIPGLEAKDQERYSKIIQSAAYLEFRLVHEDTDTLTQNLFATQKAPEGYEIVTLSQPLSDGSKNTQTFYRKDKEFKDESESLKKERLAKMVLFNSPSPFYEFLLSEENFMGQTVYSPYYVDRRPQMSGEYISGARQDYDSVGRALVNIQFNTDGAKLFYNVTKKNVDRQMAIVLDGKLQTAPVIRGPIPDGRAEISGSFDLKEAMDLALTLRAGSLPAPVEISQTRTVDPTLGRDSIESGTRALIFGGAAVVVFMLLYYRLAGVVANLALILDLLLLPLGALVASGFLGLFTGANTGNSGEAALPTLTLPGIAGIVLTIGMAVDANVLIFERIREEQLAGKRFPAAVKAGYEKVFSTIFDANVTTLLTAIILFWQGSGPIRGFAVTLSAGIIVSMYTALVFTRMVFNVLIARTKIEQLKMFSIVKNPNYNFLGKRKIAAILSVLLIIGTWTMFIKRGADNFGVDFTGGSELIFKFDEKMPVETIRDALLNEGIVEATIQYQRELIPDATGHVKELLGLKVGFEEGEKARSVIAGLSGYSFVQSDEVGPQVGQELQRQGILAIVFALIGIVIYVSFRFEFAFAIGAIVALGHDVLITMGIYSLFGRELSLPIVAALLTIVGYSVNDTIVVFDRIREDVKLQKRMSWLDVCNRSINLTLGRTLLTSITTLLTVVLLLVFGGGAINDFALALFIGICVGTYSSIFVATPVMLLWHKGEQTEVAGSVAPPKKAKA